MNMVSMSMYSKVEDETLSGFGTVKETTSLPLLEQPSQNTFSRRGKLRKCCSKNWGWVTASVIAAALFAASNLLIGRASIDGAYVRPFIMVGNFLAVLSYITHYLFFKSKSLPNLLCDFDLTSPSHPGLNTLLLRKISIDACVFIGGEYLLILTFSESLRAEINQGVISSLFILSAINTAIFTWFLIGLRSRILPNRNDSYHLFMSRQQVNQYHFIGLVLCLVCIVMLIFNPYAEDKAYVSIYGQTLALSPPLTSVVLAILTTIYMSVKDIMFKSRMLEFTLSPYKVYSLMCTVGGILMTIVSIVYVFVYGAPDKVWDAILAGILQSTATYLLIFSLSRENRGFTLCIASLCFVAHALAADFVFGQKMNTIQIIVLVLTFVCTVVTCIGHYAINKMIRKRSLS